MTRSAVRALASLMFAAPAAAQPAPSTTAAVTGPDRRVSVVGIPIPISNEAFGTGLALAGEVIFRVDPNDKVSPPSIVGGGAGYTDSHTWLAGAGTKLQLREDRLRFLGAYGQAGLHYRLFGTGNEAGDAGRSVPVDQGATASVGEGLVRTFWRVFFGARYIHVSSDVGLDTDVAPPDDLPLPGDLPGLGQSAHFRNQTIAFRSLRDTRDDPFWPTRGSEFDFTAGAVQSQVLGRTSWFQSYDASTNWYTSFTPRQLLATRVMACGVAGGRVPFFDLCQFGAQADLRGYEQGRYRDRVMFATQAEYRLLMRWRLALTVFGGVGEVAPSVRAINTDNLLPAGGIGLRFSLSSKYRVNYRVDYAVGKTGGQWIVSLGEAF